ncbi:glucoamylase family protein [Alkalibacterium sp. f15]|uniref:glucoamylase family protein n=1 Tax=Alkalibacterium sp. f15 TaxID=3414029 RepID=UPI003BF8EEB6
MKKLLAGLSLLILAGCQSPEAELTTVAEDTFAFFEDFTDPKTGLTSDRVDLNDSWKEAGHTSPTNIAMYLLSVVSAVEMDFITADEGQEKIAVTLDTLEEMETWNGLYYNWYYINDGELMTDWGQFISMVDNGWLTASFIVIGDYFDDLSTQTDQLVAGMDYSTLYDEDFGLFRGGYDVQAEEMTEHHYGTFYSETRITSYLAIGKGDVPEEHWWNINRTNLPTDTWQSQIPTGEMVSYGDKELYQGHYEYEGISYVPSWGGSMFEALMPALILDEIGLAEKGLGLNNARHVQGQIKYAEMNDLPAWGFSPAALPDGYSEFGAPVMGISGYADLSTVTPHASFLALDYDSEAVMANLAYLNDFDMYGDYGYYDTLNLDTEEIAKAYLALDQGMIMLSIANHLHDGLIREHFHNTEIGSQPEHLLIEEDFLIE